MASEELQEELEGLTCTELIKKLATLFDGEQEDAVDDCLDWFLFTYSPEYAFSLVQNNSDAFRDGLFLEITMSKIREIYEPEIFLESLNILSCLEAYEQDIAKAGAVRAIIMMMGRDLHNERSQILGCKVLANLAHDLEVCKWVGKVKGIPRLLEILKRHAQVPDVSIEVCRTLANLAFRCKQNKEIMHMESTVSVILNTLNNDKTNEKLVNAGLRAIRNIVSETEEQKFDEQLLHQVLEAMTEFPQGLDIQTNCIWILVNLMSGKFNIKKTIVDQGGLDHILTAMEHYDMDPHIQLAGSTALAVLSKISVYRQLIPKKGGIQLLLISLRIHRQIVPIQRSVLKAVYRICFNEQNRTKLGELKIVTEIMETMKVNQHSGPLQRIAILCLLKLTKNNKLKEIIQAKAVPLIIQTRNNFIDVPHIHSVASVAVEALVSGGTAPATTMVVVPKTKDDKMDNLRTEVKNLQNKDAEKEGTLANIQEAVLALESEVARLRLGVDLEILTEMVKKISSKRANLTLKQQKMNLAKEFKKIQSEIDEINHSLDPGALSPKEEDKKPKKLGMSSSGEVKIIRDKSEPKLVDINGKKDLSASEKKKNTSKQSLKKIPKEKPTVPKRKPNSSRPKVSKKGGEKANMNDQELEGSNEEENTSPSTHLTASSSSSVLRTHSRKSYGVAPVTTENLQELSKQIEELQNNINEKEKEMAIILIEKNKVDSVVNKLNMDVRATHLLIESLQKESLYHTQNREKLVTGNSLFAKHQKKIKGVKDQINTMNQENEELKKEIIALGGDLSSLSSLDKKKKKKH